MMQFKRIGFVKTWLAGLAISCCCALPALADTMSGVTAEMQDAEFWIARIPEKNRQPLSPAEVEAINQGILKECGNCLFDLQGLLALEKTRIPAAVVRRAIQSFDLPNGQVFDAEGREIMAEGIRAMRAERSLGRLAEDAPLGWAMTWHRTNLRLLPIKDGVYDATDPRHEFDKLQQSSLFAYEPLLVMHRNLNGTWLFVRSTYADGWVPVEDVAEMSFDELREVMLQPRLVVTGRKLTLAGIDFEMGTLLPLALPDAPPPGGGAAQPALRRVLLFDAAGIPREVEVPETTKVHEGPLPCSTETILRQAFKFLDERYDWGGKDGRHDCSSYLQAVYRTVGIHLPRNSVDQARIAIPGRLVFAGKEKAGKRLEALRPLLPGAILHKKGHVMLYLGEIDDVPYVIHDFSRYAMKNQDELEVLRWMRIDVMPLTMLDKTGISFIDSLVTAIPLMGKREDLPANPKEEEIPLEGDVHPEGQ
jgi:hypothetical protein